MSVADEIKEAVVTKVAEGNASLKEKIISLKATEELERRKDLALKGLVKLEQLQTDFQKIQPDHVIRDENGKELQKGFTEKRHSERLKMAKNIKDLQDALAKGLGEAEWDSLRKIIGGGEKVTPPKNEGPVVDNQ